jgi:hypothetical protein
MLTMERAKALTHSALSRSMQAWSGVLKDVNKRFAIAEQDCVSPINVQDSSNLKNPKIISLEETGFADMYPSLAGRPSLQCGGNAEVP